MKTSLKIIIFLLILVQSLVLGYSAFSISHIYLKTGSLPQSYSAFLNPLSVKSPAEIEEEQLNAAILYLDSNIVWTKADMEEYAHLQGLFEDMNQFNLQNLSGVWKVKLSKSVTFGNLCKAAEESVENGYNVTFPPHDKCYDMKETDSIAVLEYIQWISENHKKKRSHRSHRHRSHRTVYIDEYDSPW